MGPLFKVPSTALSPVPFEFRAPGRHASAVLAPAAYFWLLAHLCFPMPSFSPGEATNATGKSVALYHVERPDDKLSYAALA